MRRFLLIALTAGLLSPTAAMAESVWLILRLGKPTSGYALEKVKMSNMNQWGLMGAKWMGTKKAKSERGFALQFGYECIEGE